MKRITNWPQAVLGQSSWWVGPQRVYPSSQGLAFNWGALLGWSAVAGTVEWSVCLPLYAGGVCWTLVYDSIYAHQVCLSFCFVFDFELNTLFFLKDKVDDVQVGIRSTALLFAEQSRPILTGLTASTLSLISYAGYLNSQGEPFYLGVGLATIQLARVLYRTDFNNRPSCWKGFVGCGWAGFWIWMGALGDYVMLLSFS